MPCLTIPYHTIPYHTIPYNTIQYPAIQYHTIPDHTLPNFPSQPSCESARRDLSSTPVQQLNWIFATNQLAAETQETKVALENRWSKWKNYPLYHLYGVLNVVRLTALQSRHNKRIRRRFCMFSLLCTLALFSLLFKVFCQISPNYLIMSLVSSCRWACVVRMTKFCGSVEIQFGGTTGH